MKSLNIFDFWVSIWFSDLTVGGAVQGPRGLDRAIIEINEYETTKDLLILINLEINSTRFILWLNRKTQIERKVFILFFRV
jgi:hypothetical protein